MLQALQDELISILPTELQFPTTSVSTDVQPPMVISAPSPGIQTQPPVIPVNGVMRDWQNQFSPAASSITRDAAISILNQWQKSKRGILEQN